MNTEPPEQFGQALRRMREIAGQTQESLAELAGLSARGISDIERGVRPTPRLETVHMLADGLGLEGAQRIEFIAIRNRGLHANASSVRSVSGMLPTPASSFIGRSREIDLVMTALRRDDVRLLTLIGPGGVGKTRISIEVARRLNEEYSHEAVFVDISPIRSSEMVVAAIATRLGLREQPGVELRSVLQIALQNRSMLLVLDNLEQVLGAAPDISWLLDACPSVNILATSRVVLRIAAEHIIEIEPMPVSNREPQQASDAVLLFEERASAASSQFTLTEENTNAVSELVGRLQGMPLAIELAAARTRLWPIAELLGRLDAQLPVLAGGALDTPDRHRSMRHTIAWSYELLTQRDQAIFRAMSIFPVGCTLETASAVMAEYKDIGSEEVVQALGTLVDSSLVRPHIGVDQRTRYRMLVSVREFGLEQLEACEEIKMVRRAAHQAWAEPLALQTEFITVGPGSVADVRYLDAELQNIDEHIDWLIQHDEILPALNLYGLLSAYHWIRGPNVKARQNMERLLAELQAQAPSLERIRGLLGLVSAYESADDYLAAARHLHAAEDLTRERYEFNCHWRIVAKLANYYAFTGDLILAVHYLDEMNVLAAQSGEPWHLAKELYLRGDIASQRGDVIGAIQLTRQAFQIAHKSNSQLMESRAGESLGYYLKLVNRLDEAEEMMLRAHQLFIDVGDVHELPVSFRNLAELAMTRGDTNLARELAERGKQIARESGSMRAIAFTSQALAEIAIADKDWITAKSHLHETIQWYIRSNWPEDAVECLEVYAEIELSAGSPTFAAWCLGAVDSVLRSRGVVRSGLQQDEYQDLVDRVKEVLGDHEWLTNYDAAKELSVEQILSEVRARETAMQ